MSAERDSGDVSIRTQDKAAAVAAFERWLESPEPLNVLVQQSGGDYLLEVSRPVDECAGGWPGHD